MRVVNNEIWCCQDCTIWLCNADASGMDAGRAAEVQVGELRLGPHIVPNFDLETEDCMLDFSRMPCECCGTKLAGSRHRFAQLG